LNRRSFYFVTPAGCVVRRESRDFARDNEMMLEVIRGTEVPTNTHLGGRAGRRPVN
jgi:hypothetical protein